MLGLAELKKVPAAPFAGEPHLYNTWIESIMNRTSTLSLNSMDIVDILEAHTTGEPRRVVTTFRASSGTNPDQTLSIILSKLATRFGKVSDVASSLREKLMNFPEIRGSESDPGVGVQLREFGDLCRMIVAHMSTVRDLQTLNYTSGLEPIRSKLPEYLDNKWRHHKANYKDRFNQEPNFVLFCEFIENEADVICGDMTLTTLIGKPTSCNISPKQLRTFTTSTDIEKSNKHCLLHKSITHQLENCKSFLELDYRTKILILKSHNLCYRCFEEHLSEDCVSVVRCDVCHSTHHRTIMHDSSRDYHPHNRMY